MLTAVLWVLFGLVTAILLLAIVASRRPDIFRVERSLEMRAPAEAIYPLIADLAEMNKWNPFALRDPASVGHYSGPASGVGARYVFDGQKSGTGTIEVVEATPPHALVMQLQMSRPMACDNRIVFKLDTMGSATRVSWSMAGAAPLFAKMFQTVIDVDRMVGRDFEDGLRRLKERAEAAAHPYSGR